VSHKAYLVPRRGSSVSVSDVRNHLMGRGWYTFHGPHGDYLNSRTGVHFAIDVPPALEGDLSGSAIACMSVDYFRPHVFGLEAEFELAKLVDALDLFVVEPGSPDTAPRAHDRDAFLDAWDDGNAAMCDAMLAQEGAAAARHTLPIESLNRAWRWNLNARSLQDSLGWNGTCPRIEFVEHAGGVATAVEWPNGLSIVLPEVDLYLIHRARRTWFGFMRQHTCVVERCELEPLLSRKKLVDSFALPCWLLGEVTRDDFRWLAQFPLSKSRPESIPIGSVLDAELVARCLTSVSTPTAAASEVV